MATLQTGRRDLISQQGKGKSMPGKYLFSEEDDPSPAYRRGRRMTASDFQLVSLYTDLTRRDVDYLQSIAEIYDVSVMRELIQCRLDKLEKKKRCLDVERFEDYDVYKGYLERKYGDRMPDLIPLLRPQPRQHKPMPRVNEYPTIRSHRPLQPKTGSSRLVSDQAKYEQDLRDSNASIRGSDVPPVEKLDSFKAIETDKSGGKAKKVARGEAVVKRGSNRQPKSVVKPVVLAKETTEKHTKERTFKTSVEKKKTDGKRKVIATETQKKVSAIEGQRKVSAIEGQNKVSAIAGQKKVSEPKKKVMKKVGKEETMKSLETVDLILPPTSDEGSLGEKTASESDWQEKEVQKDKSYNEVDLSEGHTPDIAKSESLGDDLGDVFSPELGHGRSQDYFTPFEQSDEADDYDDLFAENSRADEPANDDLQNDLQNDQIHLDSYPTNAFDAEDHQSDEEKIVVIPGASSDLLAEFPFLRSESEIGEIRDNVLEGKDSFYDFYDDKEELAKTEKEIVYGIRASDG